MTLLGFVQAVPITVVLVALLCRVLVLAGILWAQPIFDFLTKRGEGWLGGLIRWVTRPLEKRVSAFLKNYYNNLLRAYYSNVTPLIVAIGQSADVLQRLSGTIGDMSEQTWRALWTLNHETIPRKITTALVPLRAQLSRHTDRLDNVEDLNRRVAVVIGTGLRSLPWGAPGSYVGNFDSWWDTYRHLWTQFFTIAQPRLNDLWANRVESLRDRFNELETRVTRIREEALPAIRQRIGRLEDSLSGLLADPTTWILGGLGLAAIPALTAGGMRNALRNLTCGNTQNVANRLCRTDADFLAQLLAGTLLFALALDPRIIARAGQELYGGVETIFRETALR